MRILIVSETLEYQQAAKAAIQDGLKREGYRLAEDFSILATSSAEIAKAQLAGLDLIVLDNQPGDVSNWNELLSPLRQLHPSATMLLVTLYGEEEIRQWVDQGRTSEKTVDRESFELLESDPLVEFLKKDSGTTTRSSDHGKALAGYAIRLAAKLKTGLDLERRVFFAALAGSSELLNSNAASMLVDVTNGGAKVDTKMLDQVAERHLASALLPEQHRYNVVICTEERGVHNELHRRVQAPDFFVFSDPFDGSKLTMEYTKSVLAKLSPEEVAQTTFGALFAKKEFQEGWPAKNVALNSPMISMVVCERHRVKSAILVSLITGDVYLAVEHGIFRKHLWSVLLGGSLEEMEANVLAVTSGNESAAEGGWEPLRFRDSCPEPAGPKLLLCQMRARPLRTKGAIGRRTIYQHFSACVLPLMPWSYDIAKSFTFRSEQWDFTPGPGRVLFMLDSEAVREYEKRNLEGRSYSMVISSGEPVTEWIGWFAFLRHAPHIKAYCLRSRKGDLLPCSHKGNEDDVSVATPPEILSIFKNGYMDLFVLHASYGTTMQHYRDTLALIFDDDDAWSDSGGITGFFGRDDFVNITTL